MRVGHRQPQLLLKPGQLFRKAIGTAGQASVVLALGQIISFDKAGVNGLTNGGLV
jgi:hypothetical protein